MADQMIALKGSVPVNRHKLIGAANPHERVEVTVKLRRKTQEGLPTVDEFLAGKRSEGITRQELADRYGARQEDVATVQQWALKEGLSVVRVDLGRRQMHLVGSAEAMSRAFGVKLAMYEHMRTQSQFRCPESDIHIPASLAPIITGVFGLNNMPVVVRGGAGNAILPTTAKARATEASQADTSPQDQFPGSFFPGDVAKIYNFPETTGAGQRVAILEFGGGFDQQVLADYFTNTLGLQTAPVVNSILVLGAQMDINDGATGEVYLDIEVVGGMAPGAKLDVYFAPFTGEGFLNSIEQAIHNDDYAAISISYGLDEDFAGNPNVPNDLGWPMLHQHIDEAFIEATAVSIPVFVSSGDQGSGSMRGAIPDQFGRARQEVTLLSSSAHVGYPASSPMATSVGGTLLYSNDDGSTTEVVWNELGDVQQGTVIDFEKLQIIQGKFFVGGATGGGVSRRYPMAPSYQTKAGINPKSVNNPPAIGRAVPDVAGNSGASTGFLVSQPPHARFPIAPVGGTSAAAPIWAALMACVRETLVTKFNGTIPKYFFNDFVYANGKTSAFRDIVGGQEFSFDPQQGLVAGDFTSVGNNRSTVVDGYDASAGYDLCTGWGTPNGKELLKQLETWLASQNGQ